MKLEIRKVQNGFILTFEEFRVKEGFEYPYVMPSNFRAPLEKTIREIVFQEWNEAQRFIRKHFGVTE